MQKATFGAGCFWGVEAAFRQTQGVVATSVGYAGGHVPQPSYQQVCTDRTGHAEVVQVEFDPVRISYERLLDVFFDCHDPTQMNCQGPDFGTQYRTAIFYHDEAQQQAAQAAKSRLQASGRFRKPIVTEIVAMTDYWIAEDYHQQYLEKRGLAHCHI